MKLEPTTLFMIGTVFVEIGFLTYIGINAQKISTHRFLIEQQTKISQGIHRNMELQGGHIDRLIEILEGKK